MDPKKLVFATNNPGKLRELQSLARGKNLVVEPLSAHAPKLTWEETGDTFLANALIKAEALLPHTPWPVLADDSGLEVEALGGRPGVHSKRFAGEHATDEDNMDALLRALKGQPSPRRAQFRCVLVYAFSHGFQSFEGILRGEIIEERKGQGGFGYDPIFQPDGYQRTLSELSMEEKNLISHRGMAFRRFLDHLNDELIPS